MGCCGGGYPFFPVFPVFVPVMPFFLGAWGGGCGWGWGGGGCCGGGRVW